MWMRRRSFSHLTWVFRQFPVFLQLQRMLQWITLCICIFILLEVCLQSKFTHNFVSAKFPSYEVVSFCLPSTVRKNSCFPKNSSRAYTTTLEFWPIWWDTKYLSVVLIGIYFIMNEGEHLSICLSHFYLFCEYKFVNFSIGFLGFFFFLFKKGTFFF